MTIATNILLASIPFLINFYANRYQEHDKEYAFDEAPSGLGLPREERYDFILVGAGAAGCVIAKRLADENFTVLLIEAGGPPPPLLDVPLLSKYTTNISKVHYLFESTPQKYAGFGGDRVIKTPAGKMLGGSTAETEMIFERGSPIDYDDWADITGDSSWKHENVLKFFMKAEKEMKGNHTGEHSYESAAIEDKDVWIQAGKELGFTIRNATGPEAVGFSYTKFLNPTGRRVNAYHAYLENNYTQSLTIRPFSVVTKVLLENKRAVGVQYERHGIPRLAFAYNEVILCAGSYLSPVILMNSGIGPPEQLRQAKVEPVSILPVGENLMDHVMVEVGPFYVNPEHAWSLHDNLTFGDFSAFEGQGDGPLSASLVYGQSVASLASSRATVMEKRPYWPDVQVYYQNLEDESLTVKCVVVLARPHSRGRLKLNPEVSRSADDPASVLLDFQYLSNPGDVDVMIEGINFCLNTIERTKAFEQLGAKFTTVPYQGCSYLQFRSKEYWECYVRATAVSAYHASGTCRMGKSDDPQAVVDSELKVRGVEGLRVADASVMPAITGAGPDEPTMMIAEKLAEQILQLYVDGATKTSRSTTAPVPLESSLKSSRTLAFEAPSDNQWYQHAIRQQQGETFTPGQVVTSGQYVQPGALPNQLGFPPFIGPPQNVAPPYYNTVEGSQRPTGSIYPGAQYPSQVPELQAQSAQSNGPPEYFGKLPGISSVPFPQNSPFQGNTQSDFARSRFRNTNSNGIGSDQVVRNPTWDRRGTYFGGGGPNGGPFRSPAYQLGVAQALPVAAQMWQGTQGTQQPWRVIQETNNQNMPGGQAQFSAAIQQTGANKVFAPHSPPLYQYPRVPISGPQMQSDMLPQPAIGTDKGFSFAQQEQPAWQSHQQKFQSQSQTQQQNFQSQSQQQNLQFQSQNGFQSQSQNLRLPTPPPQIFQQQAPLQQQQQAPLPQWQQVPLPQLQQAPLPQQQQTPLPQQQAPLSQQQAPLSQQQGTPQHQQALLPQLDTTLPLQQVPSPQQQTTLPQQQQGLRYGDQVALPQNRATQSQAPASQILPLDTQQVRVAQNHVPSELQQVPQLQNQVSLLQQEQRPLPHQLESLPKQQPRIAQKLPTVPEVQPAELTSHSAQKPLPQKQSLSSQEKQILPQEKSLLLQNKIVMVPTGGKPQLLPDLQPSLPKQSQSVPQQQQVAWNQQQPFSETDGITQGEMIHQILLKNLSTSQPKLSLQLKAVPNETAQTNANGESFSTAQRQSVSKSPQGLPEQHQIAYIDTVKQPTPVESQDSSKEKQLLANTQPPSSDAQKHSVAKNTKLPMEQNSPVSEGQQLQSKEQHSLLPPEAEKLPYIHVEQLSSHKEHDLLVTGPPQLAKEQSSAPVKQPSSPTEQTAVSIDRPNSTTEPSSLPASQPSEPTVQSSVLEEQLPSSITVVPSPDIEPPHLTTERIPLLAKTPYPFTEQQLSSAEKQPSNAVTEGLQPSPTNALFSSNQKENQYQFLATNASNINLQVTEPGIPEKQEQPHITDIQASIGNKTSELRVPQVTTGSIPLQYFLTTVPSAITADRFGITGSQDGLLFDEQHVTQIPANSYFALEENNLQQTAADHSASGHFPNTVSEAPHVSTIPNVDEPVLTTPQSIWTAEPTAASVTTASIRPQQDVIDSKSHINVSLPENRTAIGESALTGDSAGRNKSFTRSNGQADVATLNFEVVLPSRHVSSTVASTTASEALETESYVTAVPVSLDVANAPMSGVKSEEYSTLPVQQDPVSIVTSHPPIVSSDPLSTSTSSVNPQVDAIHHTLTQSESVPDLRRRPDETTEAIPKTEPEKKDH